MDGATQDVVPVDEQENQVKHRWQQRASGSPVVAGHELASAVIQDTVKYLGIQATGISQLSGPYLQVRNAGPDASDILLVGSWRTHYEPGGNGSGPILDALPRAVVKQPGAADTQGPGLLTQAVSLAAPAVDAVAGGLAGDQPLRDGPAGIHAHGDGDAMRSAGQRQYGQAYGKHASGRTGPIIEECPSDAELASPPGRVPHHHHYDAHAHAPAHRHHGDVSALGTAHARPRPASVAQMPGVLSNPDRVMEDVAVPAQRAQQVPERAPTVSQQHGGPHQAGSGGPIVQFAGLGLAAASAFASAAAAEAAAAGGVAHGAAEEAALGPGPLVLSPRPRSEWELDPAKIVLGRRLAVGGFGEVFVAKYEGTLVAVKRLLASDSDTTQRFIDEVHMLARLRHPNLLLFMGYTLTPEPSIVTEFMARGSLFHILRQAGNRPPEPRMQRVVAMSMARGMAYLHSRAPPILHLDLKSPNVLVDDRWRVKIADFGLSRVRQRTYVSSGAAAGSPEWMAPEVLRCDHYAEAADVYSFGVVLWELLTGQAPWADLNAMQVVGAVGFARRSLPDPTEGDELLLHLCKACRAHDPAQRPSFAQIVEAMDGRFGPPTWPPSGLPNGNGAALPAAEPEACAGPGAAKALPPALPPPESAAAQEMAHATAAGGDAAPAEASSAAVAESAAAAPVTTAHAGPRRLTRCRSLASVPDAETLEGAAAAADAQAPAAAPSSMRIGIPPPRLDPRFMSIHESPRSRRRYRSPRSEDLMMGRPAITARLQDGRKTPSPRTASGRACRIETFDSCEDYEMPLQQAKKQQQSPPGAAEPQSPQQAPAGESAAVVAGRVLPAHSSPFEQLASAEFGPGSVGDVRSLRIDSARDIPADVGGGNEAADRVQSMELGSPVGSPQRKGSHPLSLVALQLERDGNAAAANAEAPAAPHAPAAPAQSASSGKAPSQEMPQWPRELAAQLQEELQAPTHVAPAEAPRPQPAVELPQLPHLEAAQEQPDGSPTALRELPLFTRPLSRPGHRRVASDEAGHLQRLQAALAAAAASGELGPGSAGASTEAIAAALAAQQQRLMGAAPPGPHPQPVRRSRGLSRNSAPMRYTYGGAPAGGGGAQLPPPPQQPLPPSQMQQPQQRQSPPRARTYHAHHLAQMLQGLRHRQQAAYYLQQHAIASAAASGVEPSTPGAAALSAPVALSPYHQDPLGFGPDELGQCLDAAVAAAAASEAGGADPWDAQSELSFAFILGEDNASICSDDYRSASLDRMPMLEADDVLEHDRRFHGSGSGSGHGGSDISFTLPRLFHSSGHLNQHAATAQPSASPFLAFAAAAPAQAGAAAAVNGGVNADGAAPPADLWAALQQHSLGQRTPKQQLATAAWLRGTGGAEVAQGATAMGPGGPVGRALQEIHLQPPALPEQARLPPPQQQQHYEQNKSLTHSQDADCGSIVQQQQLQVSQSLPEPAAHAAPPRRGSAGGGGVTTYRSGRFKVTIEQAATDAQPPVQPPGTIHHQQAPSNHVEQQQQGEQPACSSMHSLSAVPAATAAASVPPAAGGGAALPTAPPHEAAAQGPAPAPSCSAVATVTATAAHGPSSTCGGAGVQPPFGSSPGAAGPCGRARVSHTGFSHGELSGGLPVAVNSVTMYRKGRFFVSHASAGTHSLSVTNPFASAATSSIAAGGGGGGSSAGSPREESEEHDGASGPASPLGGAAAIAAAAAAAGLACRQGSVEGSPTGAALPTSWAAAAAAAATAAAAQVAKPEEPKAAAVGRQYSKGRFTVSESVVAAPEDPRRPSAGGMSWELPRANSAEQGADAAAHAVGHSAPHRGCSAPCLVAAMQLPAMQAMQLPAMHVTQSMPVEDQAGDAAATAPSSPRAEHVVVRKMGRFTVREIDTGSNGSSLGPSGSGTPVEGTRTGMLPTASAGLPAAAVGMLLSVGGASCSVQGSPVEDAHLFRSLQRSGSFGSASGCSRASSQGMDAELGAQQQQQQQPALQQQGRQERGGAQCSALLAAPFGAVGTGGDEPTALNVVRVHSKGRFTVIEHAAPPPPVAEAVALQPGAQATQQPAAAPLTALPASEGGLVAADSPAAVTGPSGAEQTGYIPGALQQPAAARTVPPHGGVLYPPPLPPRAPIPASWPAVATTPTAPAQGAAAAAATAPWGQSGPQAPEQAAELHADMARMVRERMVRHERNRRHRQQQQGQQFEEDGPLNGGGEELQRGGGGDGEEEDDSGEADGPGDRCTYELSFGSGLTIQISHELQAGLAAGAGDAEGEDGDAVMLDVGIVQGDVGGGGSGSDSDSDGEAEVLLHGGADPDAGGGAGAEGGDNWEQLPLQPPGTPAHEALHDRSWLLGGELGGDWRRRRVADGGDSSDGGGDTSEDDSMDDTQG